MTATEQVQVGSYVFSKTRFRAEDDLTPVGGVIIDMWPAGDIDGRVAGVRVVNLWRRHIEYFTIPQTDLQPGLGGYLIQRDILRDFLLALAGDEVKSRDPLKHDHARRTIAGVLAHQGDPIATRRD